jgi:hypothetical protein
MVQAVVALLQSNCLVQAVAATGPLVTSGTDARGAPLGACNATLVLPALAPVDCSAGGSTNSTGAVPPARRPPPIPPISASLAGRSP